MPRYAQINEDGYVVANSYLRDKGMEKDNPNLIPLNDEDDITHRRWNGIEWEEYIPDEDDIIPSHLPSQLDRIEEAIMKTNEEIANEAVDNYTLQLINTGVLTTPVQNESVM